MSNHLLEFISYYVIVHIKEYKEKNRQNMTISFYEMIYHNLSDQYSVL